MELITDKVIARHIDRNSITGLSAGEFGTLPPDPDCMMSALQLRSLPSARRGWSSACAPALGSGGMLKQQILWLEIADHEWFIWRFAED